MVALQYVCVDASLDYPVEQMPCYIYHSCMVALQYVCVDAPVDDPIEQMPYHTHHSCMDALHTVCVDALSAVLTERFVTHNTGIWKVSTM